MWNGTSLHVLCALATKSILLVENPIDGRETNLRRVCFHHPVLDLFTTTVVIFLAYLKNTKFVDRLCFSLLSPPRLGSFVSAKKGLNPSTLDLTEPAKDGGPVFPNFLGNLIGRHATTMKLVYELNE